MPHGTPYMKQWIEDEIEKADKMKHTHAYINFWLYVAMTASATVILCLGYEMISGAITELAHLNLEGGK